jgi:putative membrane protein
MYLTTAADATNHKPFIKQIFLHLLIGWYVVIWVFLAIEPIDRHDWFLENILAVALVIILIISYREFPLSDLSYLFITVFLTLHAIGAHYTYSKVPLGFWMKDLWGLERNHFDRIAHFSFGLLLAYPLRELFLRRVHVRGFWVYYLPISGIMALSGFFEVAESWVAQLVSPELGDAYLGTQGDEWDAQKDMTVAVIGAFLTMLAAYGLSKVLPHRSLQTPS